MATQGLKIDPPARGARPPREDPAASRPESRFDTVAEGDRVQFQQAG